MRVLIAEDEVELARGLKYLLEKQRFAVDIAHDGSEALDLFSVGGYDVVVLDIMMPRKNGLEVLEQIRATHSMVPIMLLTAKAEVEDRIIGLEKGADDYLPKPFATGEFVARVKALARRSSNNFVDSTITVGNVTLNRSTYELRNESTAIRLNNKEFQLVELFFQHPNHVYSSEYIMDKIWGYDNDVAIDVIWTYIGFIRRKFKQIGANVELRTVRGVGYSLEIASEQPEESDRAI